MDDNCVLLCATARIEMAVRANEEDWERQPPTASMEGSTATSNVPCEERGISKSETFRCKESSEVLRTVSRRLLTPAMVKIMEGHKFEEVHYRAQSYLIQVSVRVCNDSRFKIVSRKQRWYCKV